ncbi:hypothetical protein XIS1_1680074 [Xenorhabdus innexi]|uniref:Uncharacterized protein n=1 Tax=Xenorhabdus innexi TaxID=290109 RepID=A0A1N6MVM8_9GAMM|nr:hypothetical protein XIS1_1680074 [Xenorhabdus innexi]
MRSTYISPESSLWLGKLVLGEFVIPLPHDVLKFIEYNLPC